MRVLFVPLALSLATACDSYWEITDDIPLGACSDPLPFYYQDADGDGWGDPDTDPVAQCEADLGTGFTVRNNRDCDDSDAQVTARVGAACPGELVAGASAHVGLVRAAREYVAVLDPAGSASDDTVAVPPHTASVACGEWGWGGTLATFDEMGDLTALQTELDAQQVYAAFVGIAADGGEWKWVDGASLDIGQISPCDELPDPGAAAPEDRLALVKRSAGNWCLGTPADVQDHAPYAAGAAHFVCSRVVPSPDRYTLAPPTDAADEG